MDADGPPVLDVDVTVDLGGLHLEARLTTRSRFVALVGPSGAGKSTLLRILAGVERRTAGTVRFRGELWEDTAAGVHVPPWRRGVGWAPQEALLFPHLDVRRNLSYGARGAAGGGGGGRGEDVDAVAALLSVEHLLARRPRRLSGGERQRVALGRALLSGPRLLLLDEPLAALDRPLRGEVAERLKTWARERSLPTVLVTHDEADARILAEERWVVSEGRIRSG